MTWALMFKNTPIVNSRAETVIVIIIEHRLNLLHPAVTQTCSIWRNVTCFDFTEEDEANDDSNLGTILGATSGAVALTGGASAAGKY